MPCRWSGRRRSSGSDLEKAREGWRHKLPPLFDYVERELGNREFVLGNSFSIADVAIGTQMMSAELVAGPIDDIRWPALRAHTRRFLERGGVEPNLTRGVAFLRPILPEPLAL